MPADYILMKKLHFEEGLSVEEVARKFDKPMDRAASMFYAESVGRRDLTTGPILEALKDGPKTIIEVAEICGWGRRKASIYLRRVGDRGSIRRVNGDKTKWEAATDE